MALPTGALDSCAAADAAAPRTAARPRRIGPQAGRALEILGHAIDYLTDEYVHQGGPLSGRDSQLEAVQLLMAANRAVYFECPEAAGWNERLRGLLRLGKPSKLTT
jgi:hypothetical protein